MNWDAGCLHGTVQNLPDSPWDLFCDVVDIDESGWARELLNNVAEKWEKNNEPDLRSTAEEQAKNTGKDPAVVLLLMLTQRLRRLANDDQLLLNVMKENCKTSPKDWTALADKIIAATQPASSQCHE